RRWISGLSSLLVTWTILTLDLDYCLNDTKALKVSFAREFNLSNCWICSQIPYHAAGLPWRAIPKNWSDHCQWWFASGGNESCYTHNVPGLKPSLPNLFNNCSLEQQYALSNDSWHPFGNASHFPQPIRLRLVPSGLLCYQQSVTANHTWFAGNSTCQYYVSSVANVSIPLFNASGQDTGEGFLYFSANSSLMIQQGFNGIVANGQSFYICGKFAYKWLPHHWHGSCYEGFLAPPLRVLDQPPPGRPRQCRSLWATPEPIREGDRLGMILLPSYGVGRMAQLYRRLSVFLTQFANETLAIEKSLSSELYQLRLLALQNRQALDYVLASQGGVCALIGDECCTYVPDNSVDINRHILSAEQAFSQWKAQEQAPSLFESLFNWLPNLGGVGSELIRFLIIGVVLCLLVLLILTCCKVIMGKVCSTTSVTPMLMAGHLQHSPDPDLNQVLSSFYEKTQAGAF
uniref:Uncharacterized protein n=1 Tax=Gopherus agassizii TaxID=38772 RepID=A0A452IJY2_9SAUR